MFGTRTVHRNGGTAGPSKFGDPLKFGLRFVKIGRASRHLSHVVTGADGLRWRARQILAATSLVDHHAIPWPDDVRAALMSHLQAGAEAAAS